MTLATSSSSSIGRSQHVFFDEEKKKRSVNKTLITPIKFITIIPFYTESNFVVVPARIEVRPIRQQAEVYWSDDADPDTKVILQAIVAEGMCSHCCFVSSGLFACAVSLRS